MIKYNVLNSEGKFAAGSDEVLENKHCISDIDEINDAELILLDALYQQILTRELPDGRISVALLRKWHHMWLGNVYDWAGKIRTVNISKGNFMFAPAGRIERLLRQFETNQLGKYTPCSGMSRERTIESIAIIHAEFILIHPFREGNGRLYWVSEALKNTD